MTTSDPDRENRESSRRAVLVMGGSAERLLFGDVLDHEGFETTRLHSLSEARAQLLEADPSLLLIELDDQVGAALAFIRWVKSRPARPPADPTESRAARTGAIDPADFYDILTMNFRESRFLLALRMPRY